MEESQGRIPEHEREVALRGVEADPWFAKAARAAWLIGTIGAIVAVYIYADTLRSANAYAMVIASFSWMLYKLK